MFRQRETNPHFLPRQNDPVIDFPLQPRHSRPRPPAPPRPGRASVEPPHGFITPQPRIQQPQQQQQQQQQQQPPPKPQQPYQPPQLPHHEPRPHPTSELPLVPQRAHHPSTQGGPTGHHRHHHSAQDGPAGHHRHHPSSLLRAPTSQKTKPVAWLVAAFCALFWTIIIVGGLIILIVYLVFRPRNPRFDISTVTLNAAYLDMGYLLNADVTLLANFTNPNTKVNVDFSYIILDLYFDKNFIATRYVPPFSIARRESRFANVHMVASQVRLSMAHSLQLQRQMERGRVNFEIRGLFKTKSKLGGLFQYSYWLYAHCQIAVAGPPTGVLIGKKCVTKR